MRNLSFDEIEIGKPVTISRTLSRPDIEALAFAAGTIDSFALDGVGEIALELENHVSRAQFVFHETDGLAHEIGSKFLCTAVAASRKLIDFRKRGATEQSLQRHGERIRRIFRTPGIRPR